MNRPLHPHNRARWRRFYQFRRARLAAIFLLGLFGVSLFAEWIANDCPILIQYEGRLYWPILKFYPEDVFTKNGRMTRPDYKSLAKSKAFDPDSGNRMIWPAISFGPLESLKPEDISISKEWQWTATPLPKVASLDVDVNSNVIHASNLSDFLPDDLMPKSGWPISTAWKIPPALVSAMATRFQNFNAPALDIQIDPISNGQSVWVSLSPFSTRPNPPQKIRLTLRNSLDGLKIRHARLSPDNPIWPTSVPSVSKAIQEQVLSGQNIESKGWRFQAVQESVRFPFRPSPGHPMGLDSSGRDVAARMLYSLRTSLLFGLLLVTATLFLGTVLGALQGYYGGWVDLMGQRSIEVWEALPFVYVLILLGSVYGQSFGLLLTVYAALNWIGISYYMRAEFLRLRKWPFVEAARVMGLPSRIIIFRHILPNALVPLVTFFPFSLVGAIGSLAALDYLGFGLPPPTPSWGELLSQAQEYSYAWWLVLWPGLALFVVMLASVFVGEGLRAAFDPKKFGTMDG